MEPVLDISQFKSFAGGLDHPECVAWGPDGNVYAGGEGGQIYRIDLNGGIEQIASTGGFILGLCLDADCNIYACDVAINQVLKITPEGEVSLYTDGSPAQPIFSPNFPVFDRHGNLYVTGSGIAGENNAALYLIRPGGKGERISEEVSENANGLALSLDENYLYVVLTDTNNIVRLPIDEEGYTGTPEEVVQLENAVPDGIAFDSEGMLYIGCYAPDAIYRLDPTGNLALLAYDWKRNTLASPTNIAFGGLDFNMLMAANFARWDLVMAELPVPGKVLNYPRL